ncbi:MAG: hypothetical protein KGZ37_03840 [Nitrosarchaeum sp.]|nr:hypothetical protein [Nitrosarchaeum sp.]
MIGNSLLDESQRYVLLLDEFSNEVYLEFYEVESVKNRQVIVDDGFVLLGDKEFDIVEEWKGSFLNDDKLFFMAGSMENFDEKIDIFVMGKFLRKTIDGSMYKITVHIHSDQTIELQTDGEIIGIIPKEINEELESPEPIELLFLIKDSHHRYQDQEYIFTTKLYDKKQNPLSRWDSKGGEISDVEIVVKIIDLNGNVLREIKGITNEYGWFDGKSVLGKSIFPRGEYMVSYTAKYQSNVEEYTKPLYVFEIDKNADYRHFIPTVDIVKGFWNDNTGNQNGLIYDDLDEFIRDDSDYIHSRKIGGNQDNDKLQVKISTYAGVTQDHEHQIFYTLRKDALGGNTIEFIVTLFEGTRQIAQWSYPNVGIDFILHTEILTREQAESITDYNNLSLEFIAQCTACNELQPNKRQGEISWIHMIV